MSHEDKIRFIPDEKLIEIAERTARKIERRELTVPERLGRLISRSTHEPLAEQPDHSHKDYKDNVGNISGKIPYETTPIR